MSKRNAKKATKSKAPAARRKAAPRPAKGRAIAASKARPATKKKVAGKKMAARAKASSIVLPPDYRPSEDEPFMNELQRMYFRQKLLTWKEEIIRQTKETLAGLHEEFDSARRSRRPCHLRDRPRAGAEGARPPAQADRQDRCRARPHRGRLLRVLRGDRRAHRPETARCAPDRDAFGRGAGAPRAARARLPRGLRSAFFFSRSFTQTESGPRDRIDRSRLSKSFRGMSSRNHASCDFNSDDRTVDGEERRGQSASPAAESVRFRFAAGCRSLAPGRPIVSNAYQSVNGHAGVPALAHPESASFPAYARA